MKVNLKTIFKVVVSSIIVILLALSVYMNFNLSEQKDEIATHILELTESYENTISELNIEFTLASEQFSDTEAKLKKENENLQSEVDKLTKKVEELEEAAAKKPTSNKNTSTSSTTTTTNTFTSTSTPNQSASISVSANDFKTYMSYRAITNTSSAQYALQQEASTDENGIRRYDDYPMVAVGSGWGLAVGDIGLVECDNGNSFLVIVGDMKSDKHTDSSNKTTLANGCRCEFIVDPDKLDSTAKFMGNVATIEQYSGYVTNITKIN